MAVVKGDLAVKTNLAVEGDAKVTGNSRVLGGFQQPYLELIDEKGDETGGALNAGIWQARDLTVEVHNDFATSFTPGDNAEFTIPAGVYHIEASAPAIGVEEHVARLADITDGVGEGTTVILGTSEYSPEVDTAVDSTGNPLSGGSPGNLVPVQTRSFVSGRFTVERSTDLQLQHKVSYSALNGAGSNLRVGDFYITNNVYSVVKMWMIRDDTI